ncbi:MAG: peptidoglycan-binding protein [Patescibacteria group bacterium]
MLKKIALTGLGIALLASPLISSADTLTDLQTQIAGLLGQLKQLQSQLTQQQGTNTVTGGGVGVGTAVSTSVRPNPSYICPAFRRALAYGANGDDVVELQKFLSSQGLLSSDSATGFFGRMTEAAVQKLQAQNGIVSSGDHATTGWGAIGPNTRAWIARWCNGNNPNFSASPRSGSAPLTVTFRTTTTPATNDGTYTVEFGDGTTGAITYDSNAPAGVCAEGFGGPCNGYNSLVTSHTYTASGTYSAKLIYQPPMPQCPSGLNCAQAMPAPRTVGTMTITVTGPVDPNAPSVTITSPSAGTRVAQGQQLTISWEARNVPSNARVGLWLTRPNGGSEGIIVSGKTGSGTYTWTVPGSNCNSSGQCFEVADDPGVWRTNPGSYTIVPQMYSPANACFGFCEYTPITYLAKGTAVPITITATGGTGGSGAPSISGVDGPAALAVGQTGTWTVRASVASNADTNLRYSVIWGDEGVVDQLNAFAGNTTSALQASGSFTHAYRSAGTYRPTFTVSNNAGSAQTSASVRVGGNGGDDDDGGGNSTFAASPTSGPAPLAVIFRSNIVNGLDAYRINFGDGQSGALQNNCQLGYGGCGLATATHTYAANGTYTATLRKPNNCESSNQGGCTGVTDIIVGTVTIVVGGTVSSGNLSATPKEGSAPLMVTFTGVGNSILFGDGSPLLIASGNANLGTVTHVYRTYGEYKAESGNASVNISVNYDKIADFRGGMSAINRCVYNNRTYQSGTFVDVSVRACGRGDTIAFKMCFGAASQSGGSSEIVTQRYTCTNGEWVDQYGGYVGSEPVNATSCSVLGGMTVADGQMVAQASFGAAISQFDYFSAFRKPPSIKCVRGEWFQCDTSGGNCTQPADAPSVIGYEAPISASGANVNLANALTALESALKALIIKLAQ